jgi:Cft2 family RNA processing exonuclease
MIASPGTARLCAHRQGPVPTVCLSFGERREMDGYALTLFPAGHCLGSAQVLVEYGGERLVYTGDFKLRSSRTSESPVVVPCDTLVMEVTFGEPIYRFPEEEHVVDDICAEIDAAFAAGEVPVVLGYALGKSQEALALLVDRGYDVAVHASILQVVDIYRELGTVFAGPGSFAPLVPGEIEGKVLLIPPGGRGRTSFDSLDRKRTLYLSGWGMNPAARNWYGADRVIPLSDHAGYDDLLRYAQESGARRVITVHGSADFSRVLRRDLGIEACHLDAKSPEATTQLSLF